MLAKDMRDKAVYIWGVGVEGQAAMRFLDGRGIPYKIIENDVIPDDAEIVVKSPGVSVYKDEYIAAAGRGVKFTNVLNIFLAELRESKKVPAVIAITGTKGKTTTASALAFMLEKLGHKTGLGGNIGTPPLDFLGQDLDYIVLEISSFQATSLEYYPDYAVIMSIMPAHLDWHLNYDNYCRDKLRFIRNVKTAYLRDGDEYQMTLSLPNAKFYKKTTLNIPALQLLGEHNLINISGVLELISDLGLDAQRALDYLADFKPIEHRLETVANTKKYRFVNDSQSTVAESAIAAMRAFAGNKIAVILGGFDNKSANWKPIEDFVAENDDVVAIIGLPDTGHWIKSPKLRRVGASMREAVEAAAESLPDGGVVLLSPAAQSFNMYKNYKERGADFAKCAETMIDK